MGTRRLVSLLALTVLASCGGDAPHYRLPTTETRAPVRSIAHHVHALHRRHRTVPSASFAARTRARCRQGDAGACRMLRAMRS